MKNEKNEKNEKNVNTLVSALRKIIAEDGKSVAKSIEKFIAVLNAAFKKGRISPTHGGCAIFAIALNRLIGNKGEYIALVQDRGMCHDKNITLDQAKSKIKKELATKNNTDCVLHILLKYENNYYDSEGRADLDALIKNHDACYGDDPSWQNIEYFYMPVTERQAVDSTEAIDMRLTNKTADAIIDKYILKKTTANDQQYKDENGFSAPELTLLAEWYYHALMYSYIGLGMTKSVLTDVLSVPADLSSMIHDNFIKSSNNMIEKVGYTSVQNFHLTLMKKLMDKIKEETGKDEDKIKKLILTKLANKYFNNWLRKIGGVQPLKVSTGFKPSIAKRSFIGRF